ncbi:MAG: hypothetical protein IJ455_07035 [Agathobacter sp.]|nr:hypothetical protein [Agathobacter sp.]
MREKEEIIWPCPISRSSNNDAYNDICNATGKPCPYFIDEGMSVCKSKMKCLSYFAKKGTNINLEEVFKLIVSSTKPRAGERSQYTNTIKRDKSMQAAQVDEANLESNLFVEELEAALKQHEVSNEESEDNT